MSNEEIEMHYASRGYEEALADAKRVVKDFFSDGKIDKNTCILLRMKLEELRRGYYKVEPADGNPALL